MTRTKGDLLVSGSENIGTTWQNVQLPISGRGVAIISTCTTHGWENSWNGKWKAAWSDKSNKELLHFWSNILLVTFLNLQYSTVVYYTCTCTCTSRCSVSVTWSQSLNPPSSTFTTCTCMLVFTQNHCTNIYGHIRICKYAVNTSKSWQLSSHSTLTSSALFYTMNCCGHMTVLVAQRVILNFDTTTVVMWRINICRAVCVLYA